MRPRLPAHQRTGHVFGDHPDGVAPRVVARKDAAARRAEMVIQPRAGAKTASQPSSCSRQARSTSSRYMNSRSSNPPAASHAGPTVGHAAAAAAEDTQMSASYCPRSTCQTPRLRGMPSAAHHVAGIVQRVAPVEQQHLAGDRPGVGCASAAATSAASQPGSASVSLLSITSRSPRAPRGARIAADCQPAVVLQRDDLDLGIVFAARTGHRVIRRRIVDEDDLGQLAGDRFARRSAARQVSRKRRPL